MSIAGTGLRSPCTRPSRSVPSPSPARRRRRPRPRRALRTARHSSSSIDLNDRCDFGTGARPDERRQTGPWSARSGRRGCSRRCSRAVTGARRARSPPTPNQLLIAAANPERLAVGLADRAPPAREPGRRRTASRQRARRPADPPAGHADAAVHADRRADAAGSRLERRPQLLRAGAAEQPLPSVRQPGRSAGAQRPLKGGASGSVLVVDSPAPSSDTVVYDVDGNGMVDEDHGHGAFVASLVKRLAPRRPRSCWRASAAVRCRASPAGHR